MKWNRLFIPTLRENPSGAEMKSHKLLVKGGFIRSISAGVFAFLPLGFKVFDKISKIIREEMDRIGAQEFLYPSLTPREVWEKSGRWISFGNDMFRLKDRNRRELSLAPTHEEIVAELIKGEMRSYRDFPQIWYQIQNKFRDEPRPRGGLIRCREFAMKDSYSLDADWEGLDKSYNLHYSAYSTIFKRCGLSFRIVSASTGLMGGSASHEFMVESEGGEDSFVLCPNCGYASNTEVAEAQFQPASINGFAKKEKVHTPSVRTVEEVASFLGTYPELIIKSIIYFDKDSAPILALIRGDYEINEAKLTKLLGSEIRIAHPDEIKEKYGVSAGFVGPIGIKAKRIIADSSIKDIQGGVIGANQDDYHIVGVSPGRDFSVSEYSDFRKVRDKDRCIKCNEELNLRKGIELGHIFKLGTRYSETMGLYYTSKDGNLKPVIMGSYGIGLGRVMASAQELYSDADGMVWPPSITPYDIHIVSLQTEVNNEQLQKDVYAPLLEKGIDVLWDNREETAGVKFKDADLIGIPLRLTFGKKLKKGIAEITMRKEKETVELPYADIVPMTCKLIEEVKRRWKM